jgi:HEAT repeat protein
MTNKQPQAKSPVPHLRAVCEGVLGHTLEKRQGVAPGAGMAPVHRFPLWVVACAFCLLFCAMPARGEDSPSELAVGQAMEDLASQDWILQYKAMTELGCWRTKQAVAPLRAIYSGNSHPWLKGRALVALAEILRGDALADATAALKSPTEELRAAALEALGVVGDASAEQAVSAAMKDPLPSVQGQAMVTYARLKGKGAWDAALAKVADKDPMIAQYSTRALFYVGTPQAKIKLVELLDSPLDGVRIEAAVALGKLQYEPAIGALVRRAALGASSGTRDQYACRQALVAFPPGSLTRPLVAALKANDAGTGLLALNLLAINPSPAVCDEVAGIFRYPTKEQLPLLPYALDMLARCDADRYCNLFSTLLTDGVPAMRHKAVDCLSQGVKVDKFALLRNTIGDSDEQVKAAVFTALGKATGQTPGEGIVSYFEPVFKGKDKKSQAMALDLMRTRIKASEYEPCAAMLAPLLAGDDEELRTAAAAVFENADDEIKHKLAVAQSYVVDWMVIGPFPNDMQNKGLAVEYPPQKEIDLKKKYNPQQFAYGDCFKVDDVSDGKAPQKCLVLQRPPSLSQRPDKIIVSYSLDLPDKPDVKLLLAPALDAAGQPDDIATFAVTCDGKPIFKTPISRTNGWKECEVPLAEFAGKKVTLELSGGATKGAVDAMYICRPRITCSGQGDLDLLALAMSASGRTVSSSATAPQDIAWQAYRVISSEGSVPLDELFAPPVTMKVAYAFARIDCKAQPGAVLHVQLEQSGTVWLNDVKVMDFAYEQKVQVPPKGPQDQTAPVKLRAGENRILVKACNVREPWRFRIRISDAKGQKIDFTQTP